MPVMDFSMKLGLELVGKEAIALLKRDLNGIIASLDAEWALIDAQYGIDPVVCEPIEPQNFYHGHRPSLIEAPIERYPNCSALAYRSRPTSSNPSQDQQNEQLATMYVEVMCKSLDDEAEVNSRAQRTADAVHRCLLGYHEIGGCYVEAGSAPDVLLTDVFIRPEVRGHGRRFLWQGARLEYQLVKYVSY